MVLDKEIHHECIFQVQGEILALRVYGPKVFPVQGVTRACEFMVLRVQAHMVLSLCEGWKGAQMRRRPP